MIYKIKKSVFLALVFCLFVFISACSSTKSQFIYKDTYKLNEPVKHKSCYDACVVLGATLSQAKEIAKNVLVGTLNARITEETENFIKARRLWDIFSGGEWVFLTFEERNSSKCFITVVTKRQVYGGIGMKPWACKIVEEMTRLPEK